jgi:hypothetical protein
MAKKAAKKTAKKRTRIVYTRAEVRELRAHSKARTPVKKIVKAMKRSEGSLRQKALVRGGPGFRDSLAARLRWIPGLITPPVSPRFLA